MGCILCARQRACAHTGFLVADSASSCPAPDFSSSSLLFKLSTKSFLQRGAELTFLSAFPAEAEVLLPPLTYLRPTGRKLELSVQELRFTVIEVEPTQ